MKKFIITALACMSVVAVAAAPSLAAGSSAKKTTGDIVFNNTGYGIGDVPAHWVFNAIEATSTSPVKGNVFYEDMFGSYSGVVTGVTFVQDPQTNGLDATFTARVTVDNYLYAEIGTEFSWTVHDVSERGVGNDYFTYLPAGGGSVDLPAITAGNIQVNL